MSFSDSHLADFGDAYNTATERYTGNLDADLSDYGIPVDLAHEVAKVCSAWSIHRGAPAQIAAGLAFHIGVMTGIEWERSRR